MNRIKKIEVPQELIERKQFLNEKVYLSDLKEFENNDLSILYNTVFNKTVTGIGGTTLALRSTDNIIILMPFVEVVNNKEEVANEEEGFIVKGGVTVAAITKYLKSVEVRKIVSTYDGLSKIATAYDRAGLDIYEDFLLVDEWQVLFQQYGLRNKVIRYLLNESESFKKKCFMTATPIKKDYWFGELQNLTELVLEYNLIPTPLVQYRARNIIDEAIAIIRKYDGNGNLHFFINSVETIKTIANTLELAPEDVRVICSKQEKNEAKLNGYKIEGTKDPVKRLNFYTSTCFEGCDIMDSNGNIFVLCDGSKAHTLVDISTTLPQIAGRIRDIEDPTVHLIYSSTRYINVTQEEFDASIDENIRIGNEIVKGVTTVEALKALDTDYINSRYLIVEEDALHFEEVFLNVDKANFEIAKAYNYKANIVPKLQDRFIALEAHKTWEDELVKVTTARVKKMSFREQCIKYNESLETMYSLQVEFDKIVIDAVEKLGMERLKELNFHKGDTKKALIGMLDVSESMKVMKLLDVTKLDFFSSADLKSMFADIYTRLDINATPKGTDITKYYHTKKTTKRVDGKATGGYIILSPKIKFK